MVNAPSWFKPPMLCKTTQREELDVSGKWGSYIAEPKHDGTRCLAVHRAGEGVRLYSRSGQDYTDHVPHLITELTAWLPEDSVVDGELAIIKNTVTAQGQTVPVTDFNATMRVMGSGADKARDRQDEFGKKITFIVYDMPQFDGAELFDDSFDDRREKLEKVLPVSNHLTLNPQFTDHSTFGELFDELVENNVEGIIIKNASSRYVFDGRPNNTWFKVKAAITMDMVVSGFTDGTGKYEGMIGALEFSRVTADGEQVYVGRCSGMTDALRKEMSDDREAFIGRVVEIKSNELCGSKEYRSPRHPQFVCFRTDKLPQDCDGQELRQEA